MGLHEDFEEAVNGMTAADLPNNDLRDVADVCGMTITIKIIKQLSGAMIYVPNKSLSKVAHRFIISKFDGSNAKALSRITGVSLPHLYKIIQTEDKKRVENKKPKGELLP